jgi:hypothetical protein
MISIGMSTSCAFPLGLEAGFRLGRNAGYDGIEVMVTSDAATQTSASLLALGEMHPADLAKRLEPLRAKGAPPQARQAADAVLQRRSGSCGVPAAKKPRSPKS